MTTTHQVLIVGGGAAGISAAASLKKRNASLDIAIVEPSDHHYYQPGWTMVGGGIFSQASTKRSMDSVWPSGVKRFRDAVASFQPEANQVTLESGATVNYEILIVAPGLKLDWDAVEGLTEALGKNGVTSNYHYDYAPYTWKLIKEMQGKEAIFTQPPMPIKCAGAPQKAMYLACDHWLKNDKLADINVTFCNAGPVLFGCETYVAPLMEYVKKYDIKLDFGHNLVRIDGSAKKAWFKVAGEGAEPQIVERSFDMIHVCPPQTAPDFIKASPLAGDGGWVDLDPATLRHTRYDNIYGLGDVSSTPNAKTAAAVRKQAPIVAQNIIAALSGGAPAPLYEGYGSCPLTVENGKIILAEFGYGGKLMPTLPWDSTKPRRSAWFLKKSLLPVVYWDLMMKGREWLAK